MTILHSVDLVLRRQIFVEDHMRNSKSAFLYRLQTDYVEGFVRLKDILIELAERKLHVFTHVFYSSTISK